MIRERYPWLTDEQFALCAVAARAWQQTIEAARIVCSTIDTFGFDHPCVRDRFAEWKRAHEGWERAIAAAEKSRDATAKVPT